MKILMVTPYLPYPPASGGQIRTLNLLKYLSKNNQIVLVSLYKRQEEKKYISHLKKYSQQIHLCKRPESPWQPKIILNSIFSLQPFLIVRNFSQEAKEIIEKLVNQEKFDLIHAETFYVMPHIPQTTIPILLVEQTIEYKVYQHFVNHLPFFMRPLFYPDIIKLKFWERHYWKKASMVATVSYSDERLIKKIESSIYPVIIPNGAGEEMFIKKLPEKKLNNPIFLFVGNFFWLQNKEAAEVLIEKIYPLLKKHLKNFKLIIAGQEAKRVFTKDGTNVEIIDIKPDDSQAVKNLYLRASLFVSPIYGPGGTRLKILAAMASGLPVVGTKTGFEGLSVEDKKHVLYAESPGDFVKKIKLVLGNKLLYKKLQQNSYELVKEKYSWDAISSRLERVYKSIQKNNGHRN